MGNMRKKIAFLAGAISFDNQNRVIDGVLRRAAEFDTDVFIFTCFVNYDESEENKVGAFQIMELPDLTTYDGVIVMKNSIQYEPASNSLMNRIKESRIPAVSVDEYIDGDGVCLIEWAELIKGIIPENAVSIKITKDLSKGLDYRKIEVEECRTSDKETSSDKNQLCVRYSAGQRRNGTLSGI
jgi:hypothetical protein